jgi:hypothetical protein
MVTMCVVLSACAVKGTVPRTNIVMAHSRGWAVEPAKNYPQLSAADYDAYLDALANDMHTFCAQRAAQLPKEPCRILFFVHGGMNTRNGTVQRAIRLHDRIKGAGVYPVFLNWRSSFPSSWWDHLAKVRKGLWADGNVVLTPFIFASDQIRASWIST